MKLTVIGPWGGYPKVNEASSGYLLESDDFSLLIDCGSGVLAKMQNFIQPENLDAAIISHYHPDHIADIGVLMHARLIQGFLGSTMPSLPVYGHTEDVREFEKLSHKNIMTGVAYDPNVPLKLGPFTVRFLKTNHPVPCYAMRFEKDGKSFVYTGDTSFKNELISFCQDADVLLCECNFYGDQNGQNAGHMNSFDCGNLAMEANVKSLILTHLPHYGELAKLKKEAAEKFAGQIYLASLGLTMEV
ncbi:MBL fold metallo-hydrolase [Cytobacillus sp. Hz8]|uniref:MBL fold metallo-hydrolase n=1 Tax=Cytobacillus sp. Hz8 TaxID=3347168 RepID=UPI0035D72989